MNTRYEQLKNVIRKNYKSKAVFQKALREARLYWNPRNFDNGDSIKEELGIGVLFDEIIKKNTGRNRYLLSFHDELEDMTNRNEILMAIEMSRNFEIYCSLWKKHAPKHFRSRAMLLYMLVDITAQGGESEKRAIEKYKKQGKDVRIASSREDFQGYDIIVDGIGKQVKSAGTLAAAKRAGKRNDWV